MPQEKYPLGERIPEELVERWAEHALTDKEAIYASYRQAKRCGVYSLLSLIFLILAVCVFFEQTRFWKPPSLYAFLAPIVFLVFLSSIAGVIGERANRQVKLCRRFKSEYWRLVELLHPMISDPTWKDFRSTTWNVLTDLAKTVIECEEGLLTLLKNKDFTAVLQVSLNRHKAKTKLDKLFQIAVDFGLVEHLLHNRGTFFDRARVEMIRPRNGLG